MTLRTDYVKAAEFDYTRPELDIGSAASHVSRNRNGALHAGERNDFRFACMILRIQDFVGNSRNLKHPRKDFRSIDRNSAEQDRLPLLVATRDICDNRLELFALCAIYLVVAVDSVDRLVRRHYHYIEFIDIFEFAGLGFRGTGHARKLFVKTEIVLNRNRRKSLAFFFYLDAFLRFDCLVKSVRPPTPWQNTSCKFIDDINVIILHDIIDIFLVKAVSPEKLVDYMNAVALLDKRTLRIAPARKPFGVS